MTWEQTAEVLAREVDRLQKENDRLNALIFPAVIKLADGDPNAGNKPLEIVIENIDIGGFDVEQWKRAMRQQPLVFIPNSDIGGELDRVNEAVAGKERVIADLVGALVAIRKLRTVGGAWDDGTVMEIVRAALKKYGKGGGAAKGGESQALQAAILGLHTLAGEFPTAMFETRKDYLKATISEINEILGKQ